MTQRPDPPVVTGGPVAAVRALAPRLRAAAPGIEQARRLPADVVDALVDAGVFRLCVPRALGGLEADVATLLATIAALAEADASTGWCAMIGATSGLLSGWLPPGHAAEVYADPRAITGGVFAPSGVAVAAGDAWRVSGRWSFASGCQHCTWLMGGCRIDGDPAAPPRMALFPASAVEIIDTWSVAGLCGTGSHDIAVAGVVVPAGRTVSLVAGRPHATGPLYRFPLFGLLALGIAAVTLGVARGALDALVGLAATKTPAHTRKPLAERAVVQTDVARAEAALGAARAYVADTVGTAWAIAARGDAIPADARLRLRLAAAHAARTASEVVDAAYAAGGGSAIYASSPLQRAFRDVHTATAHAMVAPPVWELAGRLLLGLPADASML